MQKAVGLNTAVYRVGGDPDKPHATVFVNICSRGEDLLGLTPEEHEALLRGALDGMRAAAPDTYDLAGTLTYQEHVPVTAGTDPEQPVGE
ncbi:hypothetical protein ACFUJY_29550 [Streptomyces sp. NPDC057249]|uniref:hypothetical protein n=1 Tax=Streptomyces sp. NPDC057249 TaxID=3346067 RepID=UPI00362FBB0E